MNVIGAISRARMPTANMLPGEGKALRDLEKDESILILPADKGKATVIMDKCKYDCNMREMLQDRKTYRQLAKDPTPSLERRMNKMLLDLNRSEKITDADYGRLRSSAGRTPMLYGLPKAHKENVPLRPIVSFVSSPTYRLSRFLAHILAPLVGLSASHVHNSKDFVDSVLKQSLGNDEMMISFDVISLFTCIPTDLAVWIACLRLEDDTTLQDRTNLKTDDIADLLTLCLDATYLQFRGDIILYQHRPVRRVSKRGGYIFQCSVLSFTLYAWQHIIVDMYFTLLNQSCISAKHKTNIH